MCLNRLTQLCCGHGGSRDAMMSQAQKASPEVKANLEHMERTDKPAFLNLLGNFGEQRHVSKQTVSVISVMNHA